MSYGLKFLLVILIVLPFFAYPTIACEPNFGDSWFTSNIKLDSSDLPYGVSVTQETTPHNSYTEDIYGPLTRVKNSSTTPLYILSGTIRSTPAPSQVSPKDQPADTSKPVTTFKLVSDRVYFTYLARTVENVANPNFIWQESTENSLLLPWYDIADYSGGKLEVVKKDGRPSNVAVPANQNFSLNAVYGTTSIRLPGTVTYEMNSNYNPKSHANDPCSRHLRKLSDEMEFNRKYPVVASIANSFRNVSVLLLIVLPFVFLGVGGPLVFFYKNKIKK